MSQDIAISVEHVSKVYRLYDKPVDRLKESLHPLRKKYHRDFHALDDVSFEVKKGETVGIIGQNGSGKSTLLKIITGVLTPSAGQVRVNGRVSALLELGTGFNPELTGIENVYFSGTVMGYTREEMDVRLDEILAFADIGEFVRQPVKTYSSGMFVRLAFAVAIKSNPEIMIVDEALAVGDMNFQAKCMTALDRIRSGGATVLFVSHDIGAVRSLCSECVYLRHGRVHSAGLAADVSGLYIRDMREAMNSELQKHIRVSAELPASHDQRVAIAAAGDKPVATIPDGTGNADGLPDRLVRDPEFDQRVQEFRYGTGKARITWAEMLDDEGLPVRQVVFNQHVRLRIFFESFADANLTATYGLFDDKKNSLSSTGFLAVAGRTLDVHTGESWVVEYSVFLPLAEGVYSFQVHLAAPTLQEESPIFIDVVPDAIVFKVERRRPFRVWGKFYLFPELRYRKLLKQH